MAVTLISRCNPFPRTVAAVIVTEIRPLCPLSCERCMSEPIQLTIDGRPVAVPAGTTVWEAARAAGIDIPVLCHQPRLRPVGVCRLCVVDVDRKSTRLNSSHGSISYAVFCLKKK